MGLGTEVNTIGTLTSRTFTVHQLEKNIDNTKDVHVVRNNSFSVFDVKHK